MLKINLRSSLERYETGTYCNSYVKFLEAFNRSLPFISLPSMLISFVTNVYYYYYYSPRAYFRSLTFIEFFPSFVSCKFHKFVFEPIENSRIEKRFLRIFSLLIRLSLISLDQFVE